MRLFSIYFGMILSALCLSISSRADQTDIKMQNMHLTMEIFLNEQVQNRGLSAAAWLRFQNTSNKPIKKLSLLLNSGLTATKIVGTKNRNLSFTATPVQIHRQIHQQIQRQTYGANFELIQINITLARALNPGDSTEFSIQYKGDLKSLAIYGDDLPVDTLNPDFTMIRMDSFIYPVLADPAFDAIQNYKKNQRFTPTAKITVPQGYSLAGNAIEQKRTLSGSREQIELRANAPYYGFVLGLGKYQKITNPSATHYFRNRDDRNAEAINQRILALSENYTSLLGQSNPKQKYILTELDNAYRAASNDNFDFVTFGDYSMINLENRLAPLWQIRNYDNSDHGWHIALTDMLKNKDKISQFGTEQFKAFKAIIKTNPELKKIPLKDYNNKDHQAYSNTGYSLMFAALHEAIGADQFWQFIKGFKDEFGQLGASSEDLGDYLKENIKSKKARRFVIDWISKGRITKVLKNAETFPGLVTQIK
jgi:hypothetical protein